MIKLIRASTDPDAARDGLIAKFELSREQAQAILDMRLQRLTALEADKVRAEHADLMERIGELRAILGDEARVMALVKEELAEIVESYGDERRTELAHFEGDVGIEDMIADQQMVISLTASGYVKRLPLATYRQQHRGGVGVMGMNLKDDDYIAHLHICSTHDYLLFFTNRGKVYRLKVYELPEGSRNAKGSSLSNLLPLREGEKVMAVIPTRDFKENKYLAFATAKGLIKKTEFLAYNTPIRADGIIAIKVRDGDELVQVRLTSGEDDILMVSHSGHASRFSEELVRSMGRDTSGIKGMNVAGKDNRVLAMDIARNDTELFVVTENGYGKRTPVSEYPVKGRGTKGVLTAKLTEKKGGLAGALIVGEHQELLFISQNGMVQRTSVSGISQMGRSTQGVKVMNIKDDDRVSAVALVVESDSARSATAERSTEDDARRSTRRCDRARASSDDRSGSCGATSAWRRSTHRRWRLERLTPPLRRTSSRRRQRTAQLRDSPGEGTPIRPSPDRSSWLLFRQPYLSAGDGEGVDLRLALRMPKLKVDPALPRDFEVEGVTAGGAGLALAKAFFNCAKVEPMPRPPLVLILASSRWRWT